MKKWLSGMLILLLFICLMSGVRADESTQGNWFTDQYVDDFGDPVGGFYLKSVLQGSFSNSATTNSDLRVIVFFDPSYGGFKIRLFEYGNHPVTYYENTATLKYKVDDVIHTHTIWIGDSNDGDISVSDAYENRVLAEKNKEQKELVKGFNVINQNRAFEDSAYQQIFRYLVEEKDVRCIIEIGRSKYQFIITADGFGDLALGQSYIRATEKMEAGAYEEALALFESIEGYKDSGARIKECVSALYGPIAVAIEEIQNSELMSLTEAMLTLMQDPNYSQMTEDPYFQNLRLAEMCEGTYNLEKDSQYGPYALTVKYQVQHGKVTALIQYDGFYGTFPEAGIVSFNNTQASPYPIVIDINAVGGYQKDKTQCRIELSESQTVFSCIDSGWKHSGTRAVDVFLTPYQVVTYGNTKTSRQNIDSFSYLYAENWAEEHVENQYYTYYDEGRNNIIMVNVFNLQNSIYTKEQADNYQGIFMDYMFGENGMFSPTNGFTDGVWKNQTEYSIPVSQGYCVYTSSGHRIHSFVFQTHANQIIVLAFYDSGKESSITEHDFIALINSVIVSDYVYTAK